MIELMTLGDLDEIVKIENDLFSDAWSKDSYIYELTGNEFSKCYVIRENGIIIGYGCLYRLFERAEVATIAISKEYQSKGFGKKLLGYMIDEAIKNDCEIMSLEVRVSNAKAIGLYEKMGFFNNRIRKSYYSDNYEDAYEMIKVLGGLNG